MRGYTPWVFILLFLFGLQATNGRTYIITDTNDTTQISNLRGAIIDANQRREKSIIILGRIIPHQGNQQWNFHLTISGADEDNARTGDLDIKGGGSHGDIRHPDITHDNLTIVGVVSNVTIDATGLGDRVFQVLPGATLTLENLTIIGGTAPGNGDRFLASGEAGGAIYNAGNLLLEHCIITNSSSGGGNFPEGNAGGTDGGDGGGIYNSGTLTMNDCVVAGNSTGAGADGAEGGNGGGIKNDGTCLLTDCVISENQSGNGGGPGGNAIGAGGWGGSGGGIFNSGTMVLNGCIISANADGQGSGGGDPGIARFDSPGGPGGNGGSGAGIYNAGQMQLNFSSVYDNNSGSGGNGASFGSGGHAGAGGNGAGILNTGKLSLNTSTISDNLCGNGGDGGSGNDRFGGNAAAGGAGGGGGGIYNIGSLDLTSCTIALNQTGVGGNAGQSVSFNDPSAIGASGGQGGDGGGILNDTSSTNVTVRNTLIALNLINIGGASGTNTDSSFFFTPGETNTATEQVGSSGSDGIGFDVAGGFTSQGFNLIGVGGGSLGFVNGVNADQVGSLANPVNPLIGPLQMNGGPTPTHVLLSDSPAIDQGNSFGIHTDQRGHKRPQNIRLIPNSLNGDGSDVGAFELDSN